MPTPELMAGWQRFRRGRYQEQREQFDRVALEGQQPHSLVIGCSDSRIDPAIVFDCGPGELFVVRNVANLVPPFSVEGDRHGTAAAIEYAVSGLSVPNVVVLGHSQCGGIHALLEGAPPTIDPMPSVASWIREAAEAREKAVAATPRDLDGRPRCCEQLSIGLSLRNLLTYPAVARRVAAGELALHGLYYDLDSGELSWLDEAKGRFVRLADELDEQGASSS